MRWSENDALFQQELETGRSWQYFVGLQFLRAGLTVEVPPLVYRNDISEAPAFANETDVYVGCAPRVKVEVKSRDVEFTCPEDIPRHLLPFFVNTVGSWDSSPDKPKAVVLVSQHTQECVAISAKTFDWWTKVRQYDNVRGIWQWYYAAPPECIYPFGSLIDALQAITMKGA